MNRNAHIFCFLCHITLVLPVAAMSKKTEQLMHLYAQLPDELCAEIDAYVPPFRIEEYAVSDEERRRQDLPFSYKLKSSANLENPHERIQFTASVRYHNKK
jgi:hypothetical protein